MNLDPEPDAVGEVADPYGALRRAEAKLAVLHPGSRDYALMADLVERLTADPGLAAIRSSTRRAALRDAAALSACPADHYASAFQGPVRPDYRRFLAGYISALGGSLADGPDGLEAVFSGHRIRMQFGRTGGHPPGPAAADRVALNANLRAAFVGGAEARSRSDHGRGLTHDELDLILLRYRGDVEGE